MDLETISIGTDMKHTTAPAINSTVHIKPIKAQRHAIFIFIFLNV